jgi:hypothetical protein
MRYLPLLLLSTLLAAQSPLTPTPDGRHLQDTTATPVLLNGDTGWNLGIRLTRGEIDHYLQKRQEQGFNTIGMAAVFEGNHHNAYGDAAFTRQNGRWVPDEPALTPGSEPTDTAAYDYWDHLNYAIERVADHGMYAALVIAFNAMVVGNGRGENREQIVFTPENAYRYGRFVGARYGHHEHILWMLGGDRSPVYEPYDYRPVYHAMAEGVADGIKGEDNFDGQADYGGILMSYHPQKAGPASSTWFHDAPWYDFNSVQACPDTIAAVIRSDLALDPPKPSWLFEGRYEEYTYDYRDWVVRFQAYRALTAGAFGHLYGNRYVWNYDSTWQQHLDDPGAHDMRHLYALFTSTVPDYGWGDWQPADTLLGDTDLGGTSGTCWRSQDGRPGADFITAMRSSDRRAALVYAANGRSFTIDATQLAAVPTAAYWYSPRTGHYFDPDTRREYPDPIGIVSNTSNPPIISFDPPGEPGRGNDWILIILQ